MTRHVVVEPLTAAAFEPFGDVIEATGVPDRIINQGHCGRYHDLASLTFEDGRLGVSLFDADPQTFPIELAMMERHPLGSQCFLPMAMVPFVAAVAQDEDGIPGCLRAFQTTPGQGVNYHASIWHGVLMPLHAPGLFAVVDRIGSGANLDEHWFPEPFTICAPT